MADTLTKAERSKRMSLIRGKDTKPELTVRRICRRLGYRFTVNRRDLPGCPDLVFRRRRKAVFVHGCFWHGHACGIYRMPKSRLEFWRPKLYENRRRDARCRRKLRRLGWKALVVWECRLRDEKGLTKRLRNFLEDG